MSGAKIPIVTKISSNIIRILGCNPGIMTLQGTNTYLLGNGKNRILLDTGDNDKPNYIENLKNVLKEENANIQTILLTHWHHDHIGGVPDILKLLETFSTNGECQIWKYPRQDAPDNYPDIPKTINQLKNGQEFSVDGATVKVVYTPGHTTDHIVLTMKDDNSLFSGDCILGEGTTVFEDLYEYMKSLQIILDIKPTKIYPAHGNIIDDPIPKIEYYIAHRRERESQILTILKNNPNQLFTELDIVKIAYIDISENLWPAAKISVNHHLKKLTKEKIITELIDGNVYKWQFKTVSML